MRGTRTAGPKTQTDPRYGDSSMLLETVTCVFASRVQAFYLVLCAVPPALKDVNKGGKAIADAADTMRVQSYSAYK